MSEYLEEVAEEVGASNSEAFISFISRRGQGTPRATISKQVPISERTLFNWEKRFQKLDRHRRYKTIIKAIIRDEDLDLKVIE